MRQRACVREESDALKVLLAGVKRRFREGHAALVMATNKQRPLKNAQMTLLEALSREVRMMREKVDVLCSHTGRLGDIKRDVTSIAKPVDAVETKADTVTSDVSSPQERVEDIRLVSTMRPTSQDEAGGE